MPRKWRKTMKMLPATPFDTGLWDSAEDAETTRIFGRVVAEHGELRVHEEQGDAGPLYVLRKGLLSDDGAVGHFVDVLPGLPSADELPAIYEALAWAHESGRADEAAAVARTFTTRALRRHIEQLVDAMGGQSAFSRCSGVPIPELSKFLAGHIPTATRLFTFLGLRFDPYRGVYVQREDADAAMTAALNVGLAEENSRLTSRVISLAGRIASQENLIRQLREKLARETEDA